MVTICKLATVNNLQKFFEKPEFTHQHVLRFMDILSDCGNTKSGLDSNTVLEKIASMSCKAAVKGNQKLSMPEVEQLISDLLSLENPYHCPHGRPTIISLSQYELEKKFRRIV